MQIEFVVVTLRLQQHGRTITLLSMQGVAGITGGTVLHTINLAGAISRHCSSATGAGAEMSFNTNTNAHCYKSSTIVVILGPIPT